MSRHPPTRAAQIFVVALMVAAADFALAKWAGWDSRSWPVVLSAAVVTATIVAMWSLVTNSLKATRKSHNELTRPPRQTLRGRVGGKVDGRELARPRH